MNPLAIKITPKPVLRGKVDVQFPANVTVDQFLTLVRNGSAYKFGVDYLKLQPGPYADPTTAYVAVLDQTANLYRYISISSLIAGASQIVQIITAGNPVAILPNAGIVLVNQTVSAPITLTLPLASVKTVPVLISDWKGVSGANRITINTTGADRFPGGLLSWAIEGDTGSVFLRPVAGLGYVL